MVPGFTQRKGVTGVIVTFRRGDAAAAVIGPLTKTRHGTINVHDCVEASAWSLRCGNVEP